MSDRKGDGRSARDFSRDFVSHLRYTRRKIDDDVTTDFLDVDIQCVQLVNYFPIIAGGRFWFYEKTVYVVFQFSILFP